MSSNIRGHNGHQRRAIVARLKAQVKAGRTCAICDQPIDLNLKYPNPMSFVADEIVPIARGGSPTSIHNVEPAHRWCNGVKSTHSLEWTQILQQTTKKAQQTTQTEPDLDPQGVLVKTPQQTADWLATHYQISCSGKQTHQWMQRGQIHAKKLGDHYWAISTSSLHQFGHKHQPK